MPRKADRDRGAMRKLLGKLSALFLIPQLAVGAVTVTVNGSNHTIPQTNERGWGTNVTSWIQAISQYALYPNSGTFTLGAELDFGGSFGIKALTYKSRTANVSGAGILRLANTDAIGWRNAGNSANLLLSPDTGTDGVLEYNGVDLVGTSLTQTLTNKTLTNPTINAAALSGTLSGNPTFSGNIAITGTITGGSSITAAPAAGAANIASTPATGTAAASFKAQNTGGAFYLAIDDSASGTFGLGNYGTGLVSTANTPMTFWTNSVNRMTIGATGAISMGGALTVAGATTLSALTATTVPYLDGSKALTSSAVTPTELGYLAGVNSAIQTQINAKAPSANPTFTGTITTPLTASRAVVTGASSELAASAVTAAELAHVSGVTSSLCGINQSCTLASKTLTSPTINGATLSGTLSGDHTVSGAVTQAGDLTLNNGPTAAGGTANNKAGVIKNTTVLTTIANDATATWTFGAGAAGTVQVYNASGGHLGVFAVDGASGIIEMADTQVTFTTTAGTASNTNVTYNGGTGVLSVQNKLGVARDYAVRFDRVY
jgi:hypothetical protein